MFINHINYILVVKFKRRPQYLEYFVHLTEVALSQGKHNLVLTWSKDVFTWLNKCVTMCV